MGNASLATLLDLPLTSENQFWCNNNIKTDWASLRCPRGLSTSNHRQGGTTSRDIRPLLILATELIISLYRCKDREAVADLYSKIFDAPPSFFSFHFSSFSSSFWQKNRLATPSGNPRSAADPLECNARLTGIPSIVLPPLCEQPLMNPVLSVRTGIRWNIDQTCDKRPHTPHPHRTTPTFEHSPSRHTPRLLFRALSPPCTTSHFPCPPSCHAPPPTSRVPDSI